MCTTLAPKLAVATWWAFSQPSLTCCGMRCHWKRKLITKPVAEMDFTKAGAGVAFALNFLELFTSYLYMLYRASPSFKRTIGQSSRINPQDPHSLGILTALFILLKVFFLFILYDRYFKFWWKWLLLFLSFHSFLRTQMFYIFSY